MVAACSNRVAPFSSWPCESRTVQCVLVAWGAGDITSDPARVYIRRPELQQRLEQRRGVEARGRTREPRGIQVTAAPLPPERARRFGCQSGATRNQGLVCASQRVAFDAMRALQICGGDGTFTRRQGGAAGRGFFQGQRCHFVVSRLALQVRLSGVSPARLHAVCVILTSALCGDPLQAFRQADKGGASRCAQRRAGAQGTPGEARRHEREVR